MVRNRRVYIRVKIVWTWYCSVARLYQISISNQKYYYKGFSGLITYSPCCVWCRGLITRLLFGGHFRSMCVYFISYHYIDVIMTTMASQITSLTVVSKKTSKLRVIGFVWGIHRNRWIPRTKGQLRGKCFHLMTSSCSGVMNTCTSNICFFEFGKSAANMIVSHCI